MIIKSIFNVLLISLLFIILAMPAVDARSVHIEYFHSPDCHACSLTDPVIENLTDTYRNNADVTIESINVNDAAGFDRWQSHGFKSLPCAMINNETRVSSDNLTEKCLAGAIDTYLEGNKPSSLYSESKPVLPQMDLNVDDGIGMAFIMGLLAGFSPCLIAILSFILAYTAGNSENGIDGIKRASVFGAGLVFSYLLLGILILIIKGSVSDVKFFSVAAGILTVGIGIILTGVLNNLFVTPSLSESFKRFSRKSVATWSGLFILGCSFSLIKIPCSAPMLLILMSNISMGGYLHGLSLIVVFVLGVLTPFICIGVLGGYVLAEQIRSYKKYINAISGAIIIILGLWAIIS